MQPLPQFRKRPPEFWALVKLVSQLLRYSERGKKGKPGSLRRYDFGDVANALLKRNLDPFAVEEEIDDW